MWLHHQQFADALSCLLAHVGISLCRIFLDSDISRRTWIRCSTYWFYLISLFLISLLYTNYNTYRRAHTLLLVLKWTSWCSHILKVPCETSTYSLIEWLVSVSNLELVGCHSNIFFGHFIMGHCYFCFINDIASQTFFIQWTYISFPAVTFFGLQEL
jgi:hypothetical protein